MMEKLGINVMKNSNCICLDCWCFMEGFTHFTFKSYYYCFEFSGKNSFPKARQWKVNGLPKVTKCPAFMGSKANEIIAKG